jgi:hypothetical protein
MVSQAKLISMFLEDRDKALKTRFHLDENLSCLRSCLPDPNLILTKDDLVGVDLNRVDVNLHKFEKLAERMGWIPWQNQINEPGSIRIIFGCYSAFPGRGFLGWF